jgi:hypothetical protein
MEAHTDEELKLLDKVAMLTQAGHEALPDIQAVSHYRTLFMNE